MNVFNEARVIIYRINQKGLEIFLLEGPNKGTWEIPQSTMDVIVHKIKNKENFIELEATKCDKGIPHIAVALEGDWHDIPSIRKMIKNDIIIVKETIKQHIPTFEKGGFYAIKDAVKKVLPHEYKMLKELRDVIKDRNQAKYI